MSESGRTPSCDRRCPSAPHTHAAEEAFAEGRTLTDEAGQYAGPRCGVEGEYQSYRTGETWQTTCLNRVPCPIHAKSAPARTLTSKEN